MLNLLLVDRPERQRWRTSTIERRDPMIATPRAKPRRFRFRSNAEFESLAALPVRWVSSSGLLGPAVHAQRSPKPTLLPRSPASVFSSLDPGAFRAARAPRRTTAVGSGCRSPDRRPTHAVAAPHRVPRSALLSRLQATVAPLGSPTPVRPGNTGGGKGPYFWCACKGGKER